VKLNCSKIKVFYSKLLRIIRSCCRSCKPRGTRWRWMDDCQTLTAVFRDIKDFLALIYLCGFVYSFEAEMFGM